MEFFTPQAARYAAWAVAWKFVGYAKNAAHAEAWAIAWDRTAAGEYEEQVRLLRDILGNPFRRATFDPSWLTPDVKALAGNTYQDRAFDRLPVLGDALLDAGCDDEQLIGHCRSEGRATPDPGRPMKKRWFITGVAVLLAVVIGVGFLCSRPHRINQAGFDRITEGMTLREVEEILGRPPGDYTDRRLPDFAMLDGHLDRWEMAEVWLSDEGVVVVVFDKDCRVARKAFIPEGEWPERPWMERIRRVFPAPFRQRGGVADLGP
jgi:hypothetical protein